MAEDEKTDAQESPKIIIDDDWKAQAKAEKERLSKEVEQAVEQQGAAGPRGLPPASFATLVNTLATQAALALGGMEDPRTRRRLVDLDLAKHHIDTLAVLEQKAKGNLTDEEKSLLDQALYQTRMLYVEMSQRVAGAGRQSPPER